MAARAYIVQNCNKQLCLWFKAELLLLRNEVDFAFGLLSPREVSIVPSLFISVACFPLSLCLDLSLCCVISPIDCHDTFCSTFLRWAEIYTALLATILTQTNQYQPACCLSYPSSLSLGLMLSLLLSLCSLYLSAADL